MINTKEQTVLGEIKYAFEGENMQTQCSVLGYRTNIYFYDYKLAIKFDNRVIAIEILMMNLRDKRK